MNPAFETYQNYWEVNKKVLSRYYKIVLVIAIGLVGYLLVEQNYRYLAMIVGPVLALIAVSMPRVAVYQFMLFLFSNALFNETPVVLYVDLSACLVVCAAALDFFLEYSPPKGFPKLTLNWVLLLVAVFIASVGGFNFFLGIKPMARLILMTATFLSIFRLTRHFTIKHIVTLFFWIAVANAIVALVPVLTSGQVERAFGLGAKTLDDLMMIALPIGLVLYLWSRKLLAIAYLLGSAIAFAALLATQSRLPIMFAMAFSALALFLALKARRRTRELEKSKTTPAGSQVPARLILKRIRLVAIFGIGFLVAMAAISPEILTAVWSRFEDLVFRTTGGTVALRLVLWKTALQAFWDSPIFGVGPGNFDVIHRIYQYLHLDPVQTYVQGLSAHNLVLHYMAETGIVGTSVLIALLVNQFRLARAQFKTFGGQSHPEIPLILYVLAAMFLVTAFFEAAWMWGQLSFVFVFFLALIVRSHDRSLSTE